MKTIELFSGTKSFSKVAKKLGHETRTYDSNSGLCPDFCVDILSLGYIPTVDILWASPPCTCFSVASIGHHWGGGYQAYQPKTQAAKVALQIMERTVYLIEKSTPKFWFIENPRGVLRKLNIIEQLGGVRHTVTYCQYEVVK